MFYLMLALLMPVLHLGRAVRGRASTARWTMVARHTLMAMLMIGGFWVTGWLLAIGAHTVGISPSMDATGVHRKVNNIVPAASFVIAAANLVALVLTIHVLRLTLGRSTAIKLRERTSNGCA